MRRITYANVTATLALVLAISGGAYAAGRYLINSTKQINPKVLRKLHGARGPAGQIGPVGPQGVTGHEGAKGVKGIQGEPGFSALSQLPGGKTESGELTISQTAEAAHTVSTAVIFPVQLAEPIPAEKVEFTAVSTPGAHCLGPGTAPRGFLCVYISSELNVEPGSGSSYDPEVEPVEVGSGKFGVGFNWMSAAAGVVRITGTWSVTAP
ncbi:MAG TPA: hypothetical protein VN618_06565 [Solirubrobacteraceae bacterium]|nr:hypothetical protein [Solirubrobacteraceae bacterium]